MFNISNVPPAAPFGSDCLPQGEFAVFPRQLELRDLVVRPSRLHVRPEVVLVAGFCHWHSLRTDQITKHMGWSNDRYYYFFQLLRKC